MINLFNINYFLRDLFKEVKFMVSKNNLNHKLESDATRVPHWGLRKLTVGVASVLLGTTLFFGINAYAATDAPAVTGQTTTSITTNSPSTTSSTASQSSATTNELNVSQNNNTMPAQQFNAQADSVEATQPISDDAYTLSNVSVKSVNGKNDTSAGYQDVSFDMTLNPSKVKAGDYLDIHTGLKSNGEWYTYNSRLEQHSDLTMNTGDIIGSVDSQGDYYRITFNSIVSHYQNAKASVDLKFSSYNQNAINTTLYTHDTKYKDKNLTYSPTNDAAIGDHYYTLGVQLPVEYYPESKSIEASQSASFAYYSIYGINWYQDNDGYLYTINNKDSLGGEIYPGGESLVTPLMLLYL